MSIDSESEAARRIARSQGGEPTGIPLSNAGRAERPQPRIVRVDTIVSKDELSLHQGAADGLTQAGLGPYNFAIAEHQVAPATGKPLGDDSPLIAVIYVGLENRNRLWDLVGRAKTAKQELEREGKPREEIEQGVQDAIRAGIELQLRLKAYSQAILDSLPRKHGQ